MHIDRNGNKAAGALRLLAVTAFLATAPAFAMTAVPLPPNKPVITDAAQHITPTDTIPMPLAKPDFSRPAVRDLLQFGKAPVPKSKPMRRGNAPLTDKDAALYKKIFAYQTIADWERADDLLEQLGDFRLRGHVLYQRYMHPTAYRADFDELAGWMDAYADQPGADKIYKLAMKRLPSGYKGHVRTPVDSRGINGYLQILSDYDKSYKSSRSRSAAEQAEITRINRAIRSDLRRGAPTAAYKKLMTDKGSRLLDAAEYDDLRAQIASSYMLEGKRGKARELAVASAKRSGEKVPLAGWVGGLVAWQQKDYRDAASLFEITARSSYASDWTVAAGAYWASRAHMRAGNVKDVSVWLRRAADHPRTFYGLIATKALGWDFDFNWKMPEYTAAHKKELMRYPAARRAMLLVAAGQYHLAEKELRQIKPDDGKLTEALMAYANHAALPSYAMRLATSIKAPDGLLYDAALYPESPWKPHNGYTVDRALIYALIRQESKFDPGAENRSGATGLMQLMPATASFVSGQRDYRSREGQHNLKDPQLNLDIGQSYVEKLLYQDHVGTELFSLVIAYNAGPGNLRKWKQQYRAIQDDPLLFVESIPMRETRIFVERVMANYWIYRLRMGQPTPSLDAVAEGNWARYVQLDGIKQATLPDSNYRLAHRASYN